MAKSFNEMFGDPVEAVAEVGGGSLPDTQAGSPVGSPSAVSELPTPSAAPDVSVQDLLAQPFAYLSGPAGTGKTWLARALVQEEPTAQLCATTGIAAVNLGDAVTINSLLRYFDTQSLVENYTSGMLQMQLRRLRRAGLSRIVLDEVSMLDANQLTVLTRAIDEVNDTTGYDQDLNDYTDEPGKAPRLDKLGLLLVGDFAQLPPVKAPFAFESDEWSRFADHTFRLSTIRRQGDQDFVRALMAVRLGQPGDAVEVLRPRLTDRTDLEFAGTTIVAKNDAVDRLNRLRHDKLKGELLTFKTTRAGEQQKDWLRLIPEQVEVKIGALVMLLANRSYPRIDEDERPEYMYVNGDLGEVVGKDSVSGLPLVQLKRTGVVQTVAYVTREWKLPTGKKNTKAHPTQAWEVKGSVSYVPLRLAYATTVHKCVDQNTRVQTTLRGVVPIAQLAIGDYLPSGQVRAVVQTNQPAYRIETALGFTVVASAEHRWVTEQGLRRTDELLANVDRLQLTGGHPTGGVPFEEETAYWLGLLVGDGCYTDRDDGTLHFSAVDHPELGEAFARGALRLGARRCSWRKDKRGLHTTSRPLRDQLLTWGLDYVTAPFKRIPTVLWTAHSRAWGAFLRGLFDTDGSVGQSGVILCTASAQLATEVQEMLLLLGVIARRQRYEGRRDPFWQVYIPARALGAFRAHVGLTAVKKVRRLAETLPNRSLHPADCFDTVRSVEELHTVVPMIDVEITAPHLMGFGPFLGHNSQGLSLDQVQVSIVDPFFQAAGMLYVALSRARTLEGLTIVGNEKTLLGRCTTDKRIGGWL